jgi:hypothetical protein
LAKKKTHSKHAKRDAAPAAAVAAVALATAASDPAPAAADPATAAGDPASAATPASAAAAAAAAKGPVEGADATAIPVVALEDADSGEREAVRRSLPETTADDAAGEDDEQAASRRSFEAEMAAVFTALELDFFRRAEELYAATPFEKWEDFDKPQ